MKLTLSRDTRFHERGPSVVSSEVELKLSLPATALRDAERLPWLRKIAKGRASRRELVSVYYDTKKLKLRRHDLTLRVRKTAAKRVQTIKAGPGSSSEVLGRAEWEEKIKSDQPRLELAKGTPLAALIHKNLKKKLRPVFRTEVERTVLRVLVKGSDVELAFDRGQIVAGCRREAISELELELKHGQPSHLADLARRLKRTLPVAFGARSKSERGFALKRGDAKKAVFATPIRLKSSQSAGAAFGQIGLSCLHHFAANEEAVRAGDAEGIHQMRVGLRRLRAAISLFSAMLPGNETERVKGELKWLTEQLGPARDLDVLVGEAVAPLRRSNPDKPEIRVLEQEVKGERREGFKGAQAVVRSDRYRHLTLLTALWLIDGDWVRNSPGPARAAKNQPIASFAADILRRRSKKIIRESRRLKELDDQHRHKLRIAVKKLRYGCDFFESLYERPKALKHYLAVLKQLQDALGKLNDIRVHSHHAERVANPTKPGRQQPQKAYAMGVLTGRDQIGRRKAEYGAVNASRKLAAADSFW